MEFVVNLSEETIKHIDSFENVCHASYIVKDVSKFLNIECDCNKTSLKDLGVKYCYLDKFENVIVIKLKEV